MMRLTVTNRFSAFLFTVVFRAKKNKTTESRVFLLVVGVVATFALRFHFSWIRFEINEKKNEEKKNANISKEHMQLEIEVVS